MWLESSEGALWPCPAAARVGRVRGPCAHGLCFRQQCLGLCIAGASLFLVLCMAVFFQALRASSPSSLPDTPRVFTVCDLILRLHVCLVETW